MKNIDLSKFLTSGPTLKEIDLTKGENKTHKDIKTDGTTYLALHSGRYVTVSFGTQWYGLTSNSCGQYDKPGTNSSHWERLWEIVENISDRANHIISFKEVEFIYKRKKIYKTDLLLKYSNILMHENNYENSDKDYYFIGNSDFIDYYHDLYENNDLYYDEEDDTYFRDVNKHPVDSDCIVLVNDIEKYIIESIYKNYASYPDKQILKDLNGTVLFEDFSIKHVTDFIRNLELEILKNNI